MSRAPTPAPEPEPTGADPSMEDILASIRRILNEDDAPGPSADAAQSPPAAASPAAPSPALPADAVTAAGSAGEDEDVLVLDEGMLVSPPPEPLPSPAPASAFAAPPLPEPSNPVEAAGLAASYDAGLLAPESAAAATSSVSSLLRTLSTERGAQVYRGGPTIEDLVREELRPLLKAWLDQQLPPMVERLVRQEIERVAGRAGL